MDKYIGRLLDNRYEILEVIGTGGMAVVYKARCHRLNRLVAIKILKDDYLEDEEFRRRFHSESQAVAMLSHPNIVSIYDVSTSITADYIVMELIDGITLKQYMEKKGVLNWKETLHFAIQIGKALEHAHGRGIVHRDIKPHNVMVLKNGSVKVTDFGIARMMSKGNTLTKEALGSVHYISPEQAKGGRVDSRSDIYSLGVVMYEMMSGRPPYDGESPVAVAIQHINGGAAMPSTLNPNIPGGLEQIIMKAMAHEPVQRYDSATQMLSDMDEFRKNPAILFDYNTPPIDAVTKLPKPPLILDPPAAKTTAERVEEGKTGERHPAPERRPRPNANAQRRTPPANRAAQQNARRRKQEKENKAAIIAIIVCILTIIAMSLTCILTGLPSFLLSLFGGEDLVTVPNLVGQVYEELPEYPGFEIKLNERVHDNTYPAGQIISQTPEADEKVEKNNTIYVTVSLGKAEETVTMPDIVDWELSQAEKCLHNLSMNLRVEVKEEHSDTIAQGSVIRTEPAADTELAVGQEITIYISLGVEIKTSAMPDVIGDKKDSAIRVLESQELDLEIVVEEIFDSNVSAGDVIRTEPEKNASLKTGQKVTVYVSKGAEMATMPNVTGIDIDKAVNILINSGFKNYQIEQVASNEDKDTVVKQSVEKDTKADVTTKIVLEVSKGPMQQPEVTKDVAINLRGSASTGDCHVLIKRGNEVVFNATVAQGTETVTLNKQTGSGSVYYEVVIAEEAWIEKVSFDGAG